MRETVELLYSATNPPPHEPPAELHMVNPGLWRVAALWWYDHQPDAGGKICHACNRRYPCDVVLSADGIFRTAFRRAREIGVAVVLYPKGRNV